MTTAHFDAAFAPDGTIALQGLQVQPHTDDTVRCRASLTVDKCALDLESTGPGTIGAMSEMLYGLGVGVEIVSLYHQQDGDQTAAYLQCTRNGERCWAYGRAASGEEATVRALIAAANQLTGRLS